jgi:hypothetical protein
MIGGGAKVVGIQAAKPRTSARSMAAPQAKKKEKI